MSETFEIVPSGAYVVEKSQPKLLEAYLGSCVGLTIVDRKNGVGGLYHILLPEPPLPDTTYQREAYAKSGLPIFFNELIRKGADKSRLEAVVAGGALIAPAITEDFYMNVGGRTLMIVEEFLRDKDIPIVYGETGGFFSCKITLNLQTMNTKVEPIGEKATKVTPPSSFKVNRYDIIEVIPRIQPIPQIALEILAMLRSGNYDMALVADKVEKDQVISAKILGLCNSPYLGCPTPITSIERAVVLLGERRLLQMILSACCHEVFATRVGGYSMCRGGLFRHSLVTAHLAETIAGILHLSEGEAYTAGLLHDIGKVVLDQYIHHVAPLFYRKALVEGADLKELERQYFGMDHGEAGKLLAEYWHLPADITEIIEKHDDVESFSKMSPMTKVVLIANVIATRFATQNTLSSSRISKFDCSSLRKLMPVEAFYSLVESITTYQRMV
ncbi:MAG: HDOD domain-containing protein [Thermodesulforhabdaceae bacterium]